MLSIDALMLSTGNSKVIPSFFIQNGKKMFYDLSDTEKIVGKNLWDIYRKNVIKDEREVYSGFSDDEIISNINTLLLREPNKGDAGNTYFKKDLQIRTILENILRYMENVKKQKKCGESSESCVRFITNSIQDGEKIDQDIFL